MVDEEPKPEAAQPVDEDKVREAIIETPMLDEAKRIVAEMRAANMEKKALLDREERLRAEQLLGGRSEAGSVPLLTKEVTPLEYAKKVIRGELNEKR